MVYDGTSHAVMMATPDDLEDFAYGFALTERLITKVDQIREVEVETQALGIELRGWLDPARSRAFGARNRRMAGATGCGMCGLDSLREAVRPVPQVPAGRAMTAATVHAALASLAPLQRLHSLTRATHAAGFFRHDSGLAALREDVGRHNALDKLIGALARAGEDTADGVLVLTSRISVELVQKAAIAGFPVVVAVSAPTALALRVAEEAGITVVAAARHGGFEIFSHQRRIVADPRGDVPARL
jgi:FdhD protein